MTLAQRTVQRLLRDGALRLQSFMPLGLVHRQSMQLLLVDQYRPVVLAGELQCIQIGTRLRQVRGALPNQQARVGLVQLQQDVAGGDAVAFARLQRGNRRRDQGGQAGGMRRLNPTVEADLRRPGGGLCAQAGDRDHNLGRRPTIRFRRERDQRRAGQQRAPDDRDQRPCLEGKSAAGDPRPCASCSASLPSQSLHHKDRPPAASQPVSKPRQAQAAADNQQQQHGDDHQDQHCAVQQAEANRRCQRLEHGPDGR